MSVLKIPMATLPPMTTAHSISTSLCPVIEGYGHQRLQLQLDANVDDTSCDIWSCVCDTETGTPVQFYMNDAFGDGWNGSVYTITSLAGDVIATGTLDDAAFAVDSDNFAGPEFGYDLICLELAATACLSLTAIGHQKSLRRC